jgi:hypothetical protein
MQQELEEARQIKYDFKLKDAKKYSWPVYLDKEDKI